MFVNQFLILAAILFCIGVYGVIARKNGVMVLMAIELILNAVNLNLIAFSMRNGSADGQTFALFVIVQSEMAVPLSWNLPNGDWFYFIYRINHDADTDWQCNFRRPYAIVYHQYFFNWFSVCYFLRAYQSVCCDPKFIAQKQSLQHSF